MNILHMKYAVEVAKCGSINKAAEELFVAQANLSRSIKTLEADLGISIFDRSFKGMVLTPEGEEFIRYAKKLLNEIDDVEQKFKSGIPVRQRFSVAAPRVSYLSDAFAHFAEKMSGEEIDLFYLEGNTSTTINNVLTSDYKLGIIRYPADHDSQYKAMLEEKGLEYSVIHEFTHRILMSCNNPLAEKEEITPEDLKAQAEIQLADSSLPTLPVNSVIAEDLLPNCKRRIFVFDRSGVINLFYDDPETFLFSSPLPKNLLERYHLVERPCTFRQTLYKDVLIYRKGYKLNKEDRLFISEITRSRRECAE